MQNYIKNFLSIFSIFFFLSGVVQADCIVTTKNFSKSSRVLYVNPTNGSDQLAKIYNYNLGNLRNPYEPKQIVAFQNIDEAIAAQKAENGDLILIRTGSSWTKYDVAKQNVPSDFNSMNAQISTYSQQQCTGENLTWVPSAVNVDSPSQNTTVTEFANTADIAVAKAEIVEPNTLPTSDFSAESTQGSSTSSTGSKKSSGGSSSGGASTNSNSNPSDNLQIGANPSTDSTLAFQQKQNTSSVKNNTDTPQDITSGPGTSVIESDLPVTEQDSVFEPNIPEEVIADIDNEQSPKENEAEIIDSGNVAECSANAPWQHAIQTYPKDSNGWSIIKPDIETKIVYVSSSEGDDSLGQTYNGLNMTDPFNPGNIQAYKTIEKAYAQVRDGKPDWILLKKGDRFEQNNILWLKSGKSQSAHFVFGAYGPKNSKRPIIETGANAALQGNKNRSFITIAGLEFYASGLDPKSDKFLGWDSEGGSGISNISGTGNYGNHVQGIHLENNRIDSYRNGVVIGGPNNKNIVIRRNQILNSYGIKAHSQGIFLSRVYGGLIEENIFDHNGWYQQRPSNVRLNTSSYGYATYFNHNVYIVSSSELIIRKNLSSRSSSIGMKFTSNSNTETKIDTVNSSNVLIENNLVIEGEVGFSIGGNTDFNNGYRWDNIQVINNVLSNIGRTKPTNRNLSFNIEANDWKTGTICSNTIVDRDDKTIKNTYGILTNGHVGDITVANNRIVNFGIEAELYSSKESVQSKNNLYTPVLNNVNFLDNYVKSKGYSSYNAYITAVINDLKESSSSFYDVTEPLKYIQSGAR